MKSLRLIALGLCLFCFSNVSEAGLLGGLRDRFRGGGGGSETEDCPDGRCGLLDRFRGGNDPQPTPQPELLEPIQEIEASGMPPWAYLMFSMPVVLILGAAVGGGSYLVTRKMQESD